MVICCMAQETQTGTLYQPRGVGGGGRREGGSKGRGHMYSHGRFMLRFDRKQQNSVKQLSFNKKIICKKPTSIEEKLVLVYFFKREDDALRIMVLSDAVNHCHLLMQTKDKCFGGNFSKFSNILNTLK